MLPPPSNPTAAFALAGDPVSYLASWLAVLGWSGNAFYFSRFLVQWWLSEKAGRSLAPPIFWWLSWLGAACLGCYAFLKGDGPMLVGYSLTFVIYGRNLSIQHMGPRAGRLGPIPALALAAAGAAAVIYFGAIPSKDNAAPRLWLAIAFCGQIIFTSRFIVQWFATERTGKVDFPVSFWWMSLVGNIALLAYSIRIADPVFIAAFAMGPLVQIRNLMLIYGQPKAIAEPVAARTD